MHYVDRFGHGLHQLLYVSYSTQRATDPSELSQIVAQSDERNRKRALTGALLVYGDCFVQVLEGDHTTLEDLFRRIEADTRHRDIVLKGVEPIENRMFGRWGIREGRVPIEAARPDLGALDYHPLLTLLRLSVRAEPRKAA